MPPSSHSDPYPMSSAAVGSAGGGAAVTLVDEVGELGDVLPEVGLGPVVTPEKSPMLLSHEMSGMATDSSWALSSVSTDHSSSLKPAIGAKVMVLAISVPVVSQPTTEEQVEVHPGGEAVQWVEKSLYVAVEHSLELSDSELFGSLESVKSEGMRQFQFVTLRRGQGDMIVAALNVPVAGGTNLYRHHQCRGDKGRTGCGRKRDMLYHSRHGMSALACRA